MLFAYLGPDTMLPLTSVFAAVVGVVLMFGRQALRIVGMAWAGVRRLAGLTSGTTAAAGTRAHGAHASGTRSATRRPRRTTEITDRVDS
jgi:hypothetical protein